MRKIKLLLTEKNANKSNQFNKLIAQASQHLNLQDFWRAVTPKKLSDASFAGSLSNGELFIYTNSAAVATKIKLISGSLLTQLQNLQKEDPNYKEYKVTGIKVKVQVKSQQKRATIEPKRISSDAAATLKKLASELGDTALAKQLNNLAKKS